MDNDAVVAASDDEPEVVHVEYGLGWIHPERHDVRDLFECARADCMHWAEVHKTDGCTDCECRLSREAVLEEVERLWPRGG